MTKPSKTSLSQSFHGDCNLILNADITIWDVIIPCYTTDRRWHLRVHYREQAFIIFGSQPALEPIGRVFSNIVNVINLPPSDVIL